MSFVDSPASTLIFLVTIGLSLWAFYKDPLLFDRFVLHPYSVVRANRWQTLITSGFLHADIPHLLFNMMTFFFFAFQLERILGPIYFIVVYFGSMIIADLPSISKHKNDDRYHSLGASGAISGVLFSFILFAPQAEIGFLFIPFGIPSPIFGLLYLIWCWYAAKNARDNINHDAHLFGALAGIVITIALVPEVVNHFVEQLQYVF